MIYYILSNKLRFIILIYLFITLNFSKLILKWNEMMN